MSAGFEVKGEVFWGTNGAVEAYVEALAELTATRFGTDAPLAVFFREEREGFSMGSIVFLDEWLTDATTRNRMAELFDTATEILLREDTFSDSGREWVVVVVSQLRVANLAVQSVQFRAVSDQ